MLLPITGLLEVIIQEVFAENRRKHEERMQEVQMIANSQLRDAYVQQILLDKFLAPVENAQHQIQNTAKHAQYLAEVVTYYHQDHGATKEEAAEISRQFRVLASLNLGNGGQIFNFLLKEISYLLCPPYIN